MTDRKTKSSASETAHFDVVGSIVAYKSDAALLCKAIASFLNTSLQVHLYLIDNSPTPILRAQIPTDNRITYIKSPRNVGFGSGHNVSMRLALTRCRYFLVLNPDVYFERIVVEELYLMLEQHPEVTMAAPQVRYPDGTPQVSRRLLPSPLDLFLRRIPLLHLLYKERLRIHQYDDVPENAVVHPPFLLGCFLLVRTKALQEHGLFDERFFMYLEDVDLCRRLRSAGNTLYYGPLHIYHVYQRASSKSPLLFVHHLVSAVRYFNKWGWWQDKGRDSINAQALQHKKTMQRKAPSQPITLGT